VLALLLAMQLGCQPEPEPSPPVAATTEPTLRRWRLAGVESNTPGASSGFPPTEVSFLPPDCRGTCIAEHWRPLEPGPPYQAANDAVFLRMKGENSVTVDGLAHPADTRWPLMGSVLGPCIGDPLALPPADDPEGSRMLEQRGAELRWVIRLSGANGCNIDGELRLPLRTGRVDASLLSVDGLPWSEEGAELAAAVRRAWLRLLVRESWPELTAEDQLLALEGLSKDPDPEAEQLLLAIIDRDPSAAADAQHAVDRRHAANPEAPP